MPEITRDSPEYKAAAEIIKRVHEAEEKASYTKCPKCKQKSVKSKWSGIACTTEGCGYWCCA